MEPRVFKLTRTFEAPRALVFRLWTEGEHLRHWWLPRGTTMRVLHEDVRPGGILHYAMDGGPQQYWARFAYREITPPERLVWVNSFADEQGNVAPMPYMDGFPAEMLNEATFVEDAGRTTVRLRATALNATPAEQAAFEALFPSMEGGFGSAFDGLVEYIASL
jgi:uncharacterized protein YndB with AHSA1/START domain